ncbi:AAA family ATPase [Salinicoccus cyprini]|uniref:AAA family ATPase n=1 Tax=Salinicoccus cyprini TaxID=2493691 RepID=A0A558AU14_9STAP|nr:AAA family ATPase [Salinicoccus cyprini]TVT27751.1 AAA family ATPase [Salinicoccus cyprini]
MIKNVNIKDVASYDSVGSTVDLRRINYIYGSNGTGKTTISEFLRNTTHPNHISCGINWDNGNSESDLFVYNRNFVQENFNISNEIKGIFTLGKESTDITVLIDEKKNDVEKHQERIGKLRNNIEKKKEELSNLQSIFTNQCWNLKLNYDETFEEAFTGLRNNKKKFMERCLYEVKHNNKDLYTYEELKSKISSVFKSSQEKVSVIPEVSDNTFLEKQSIFQTKIIGKKDIDIASLISKLNISDWVQQGHKQMEETNGICPFCQQELPNDFQGKLDEYFDETYTEQIRMLNSSIEKYKNNTTEFFEKYNFLKSEDMPYIDKERMKSLFELINSTYKENIQLLERKRLEPSRSVELRTITSYIEQINSEVKQANIQIAELNKVIDNLKEEKEKLIQHIWRFIVEENKGYYESYITSYNQINLAITGMEKNRQIQREYKGRIEKEIIELQNQLTSVVPSIHEINKLLKSFGFTNFELAESKEPGHYKIIREGGEDANETLSEGEKTFITFLYFYQLINGSNEQDKVNTPRVVVVDDPISSLDSNILFMVSNLINNLKKMVRSNDSNFKQLIILTHNVYFHKEISFNKGHNNKKLNDETFWIVRKTNNKSSIYEYDENPIKNSYELLWKELKENSNSITTPNIMRRILENYFKFFGNIDVEQIIEKFPEEEKLVCKTLLSWVNDGSHHINDDLYVDTNQEGTQNYINVFKRIFQNSMHESHYNMMMGD